MEKTIDAKDKTLGRIAGEAAIFLMGKNSAAYSRNKKPVNKVTIINASGLKVSGNKMAEVQYERYSGYPGGLKKQSMEHVVEKKGHTELLKLAVYGMLPGNKLRSIMMKNLTISE